MDKTTFEEKTSFNIITFTEFPFQEPEQRVAWAAKPNIASHEGRALGLSAQPTKFFEQ